MNVSRTRRSVKTVRRRSGIVPHSEFVTFPVQQRITSCCAAPGKRQVRSGIARTRTVISERFPDAAQRETVRRRSGIVPHSEFVTFPVQQRTTSCCAAPGKREVRSRIARMRVFACKRFPDAAQRETVRRRSGIVSHSEFVTFPVQQRITYVLRCARETQWIRCEAASRER